MSVSGVFFLHQSRIESVYLRCVSITIAAGGTGGAGMEQEGKK